MTKHSNETVHGASAIIVKNKLKRYETFKIQNNFLPAINIVIEDTHGSITFSTIYYLPKYNTRITIHGIMQPTWKQVYSRWGVNAKHFKLAKCIDNNNLATGKLIYWHIDCRKQLYFKNIYSGLFYGREKL